MRCTKSKFCVVFTASIGKSKDRRFLNRSSPPTYAIQRTRTGVGGAASLSYPEPEHRVISANMTLHIVFFPFQFHFSLCCGALPPSLPPSPFSLHPLCQIISARLYSPPFQSFFITAQKGAPNECAEKDDAFHCQMQNKEWKFFSLLITCPVTNGGRTPETLLKKIRMSTLESRSIRIKDFKVVYASLLTAPAFM